MVRMSGNQRQSWTDKVICDRIKVWSEQWRQVRPEKDTRLGVVGFISESWGNYRWPRIEGWVFVEYKLYFLDLGSDFFLDFLWEK